MGRYTFALGKLVSPSFRQDAYDRGQNQSRTIHRGDSVIRLSSSFLQATVARLLSRSPAGPKSEKRHLAIADKKIQYGLPADCGRNTTLDLSDAPGIVALEEKSDLPHTLE
jgi:hypothetical protein